MFSKSSNKYLLFIIWILFTGCFCKASAKTNMKSANDVPINEENDYDDEQSASQEFGQPSSTLKPYFEYNNRTVYVKEADIGKELQLNCPVRNGANSTLVWFKENNSITLGDQVLLQGYELDKKNNNLIIKKYNDKASVVHFKCEVLPHNIHYYVMVKVGEAPITVETPPDPIQVATLPSNDASEMAATKLLTSLWMLAMIRLTF